ncbi:MAG: YdeI/OmpD-associated family protein [Candidatus Kapabacteria bacterium]|jgi:hypothetical protein|nr:YdeI/OmpD-associated family protein [Candidatus Kapabacteria bacterium]
MNKATKISSMQDSYSFEGVLESSASKIYQTHVIVPSEIASALLAKDVKRVVATLYVGEQSHEYQCGLIPRGKGKTVIMVNKEIRRMLRIDAGAKVTVTLRQDDSEYGLEMPEELAELMRQDEEGNRLFHALTEGKQRTLLYVVSSVKKSERRIERAMVLLDHLKKQQGKIDYKKLYQELKVSNRYE